MAPAGAGEGAVAPPLHLRRSTHEQREQQNNWKRNAKHPKQRTSTETHVNLRCCVKRSSGERQVKIISKMMRVIGIPKSQRSTGI
jgi:hypothetical protein